MFAGEKERERERESAREKKGSTTVEERGSPEA